jgi:hypothetical protein
MRRALFPILGALELAVAVLLVLLGAQLPRPAEIRDSFARAERVTVQAGREIRVLQRQVDGVRQLQLPALAGRLKDQTRTITAALDAQTVDFDTVRTMRDALVEVSSGLRGLADSLDAERVGKLGVGLGETAAFLEDRVVPAAQQAATQLEASAAGLQADAKRLSQLLRTAPLDLKVVREVHTSLGRFREGLDRMDRALRLKRLEVVREGFTGLETSLSSGAGQVERLSRYSYPAITVTGVRMQVTQRPFWPEGDEIATGMRKAAAGVTAANKELEDWAADLPRFREAVAESGKIIDKLREALGVALEQQDKLEPVLRDVPTQAARLAEDLPRLTGDLARILRETDRLKEVARALRQAQKGVDAAVARWPEMRTTFLRMADVLKTTSGQLGKAIDHRHEYETALEQTKVLGETFSTMLPLFGDQLDLRLSEEERALEELSQSLEDFQGALPVYERSAGDLVQTGRWLAWLVAAVVALHGVFLIGSGGRTPA